MHVRSSMTIMPPDPIIEPTFESSSKSTGMSRCFSGMQPPEGPPVWIALNFRPFGMPPPIPNTISRSVIPIGTSTRPVLLILPTSEKIFVPVLPGVPIEAYHSAPLTMIGGTFAHVSTLLRQVGLS